VLLVHRPKYDDWAFPKGKLEAGESWEEAAAREVEKETGLRCGVGEYLGSTQYPVRDGMKEVRYFRMETDVDPTADHEIDELRWATPDEARALLSYDYDRQLLDALG
jgi:8-oxo-dGTP diphosphatase